MSDFPRAVEDQNDWQVEFEDGTVIPCEGGQVEAEALAEAWTQWPFSPHPPVEESRSKWRTGFADGASWHAERISRAVQATGSELCVVCGAARSRHEGSECPVKIDGDYNHFIAQPDRISRVQ